MTITGKWIMSAAMALSSLLPLYAQRERPTRIVVADANTTHHLNLYVAQEKGFFAKRNLDVRIVDVRNLAAARDMVVTGRADVYWACPTAAMAAIANGAPMRVIAQVKTPCTSVMVVPADSPIQDIPDLRGRRVAGISPTCEAIITYVRAARDADADFTLVNMPGGPSIAALQAGAVEAAILEEPQASIAELMGFRFVRPDLAGAIPCRTINARTAFIQRNTDALKAMIEAVEEANALILEDPTSDEIVAIARKFTDAPEDAIRNGNHRLLFQTELQVEGLILLADALRENGDIRENPGERMFANEFRGITWGRE